MENQTIATAGTPTADLIRASAGNCDDCGPNGADTRALRVVARAITGKWKMEIISCLMDGAMRFGALRRALPGITQHMLSAQLREMTADGLVMRNAFAEIPLRVEYQLSEAAWSLIPVLRQLLAWAREHQVAAAPGRDGS
ncbi:winged helix-turn-helix transcriptional regulator [Solimonas marina]|uniref:Helix-turn-helix transcriptional regulator n=1 Tax=Solimonas marina TaxID=2714601 RepID=A0A969WBL2_9GAMM|nr:helix-turn-helix domain-containing protein [Solimonas marina]NKF23028.1 helix-turn-helix transcriptional regulator [Solimonas marina]